MNPFLVLTDYQTKEPVWLDPATIVAIKPLDAVDCYGLPKRTRIDTKNGNVFIVLEAAGDVFLASKRESYGVGDPA